MTNCLKNPYAFIDADVMKVVDESSNIKTFTLKPRESISFRAGQFMEVTLPGIGEAPFTPSSNHNSAKTLDFTIMSAGRVTKLLHQAKTGDVIGLRGPYGTQYPLDKFKQREVFIVGGGVGLAPLRALLYALFNEVGDYKKIILRYGARTSGDIIYKNEIDSWKARAGHIDIKVTCDVGDPSWNGNVGLVTTILKTEKLDIDNAVAIVCGPPIMMKFATFKLLDLGFKEGQIYLSMEKNMSCGIGKCGHCRIGPYYACKDGPVFSYDKIKELPNIWD
ncbi:MAG: FAD/NAD(P)-binding protein [Candidatus Omnitrophica bacterium]|nr:FAD/NAD(P)-binding protein [Candidatus Omnitrophota bacterium]MBU1038348.1 FAD/NAD(P)-binding protein [Candidatus Omnitrophota bacterium]MBU1809467.1 FAD/NAD(P)-binding protein [Candidatus Omnitrophota bacterium]